MKKYTSTHHLYIKIYIKNFFEGLTNCIPINIIPNILNEGDIDVVNAEIVKDKDFENQVLKQKHMNR